MRSAKALGGHLITKNKVEGQMAIWTRKNGMAVNNYLAVKKPKAVKKCAFGREKTALGRREKRELKELKPCKNQMAVKTGNGIKALQNRVESCLIAFLVIEWLPRSSLPPSWTASPRRTSRYKFEDLILQLAKRLRPFIPVFTTFKSYLPPLA